VKRDPALLVALAFTGATALALEVIWSRAMIPWVGGTALSQIATVGTYMGGLFLGSALAVRWLARLADPRTVFLIVETAAALLSLLAVLALPLADPLFALFSRGSLLGSSLGSLLRGLVGGGLMLPATVLMGLSFPVAIAAFDRGAGARGSAALAYGVNTIGATLGTLLGGFLLVPWLGVKWGGVAIVLADLGVLAWAWTARLHDATLPVGPATAWMPASGRAARGGGSVATGAADARDAEPASEWPMLVSIALGGAVALGLEAILFRVLGLLLGPTARAFTVVLAVYVLGLGVGSLLVRFVVERSRSAAEVAYLLCWLLVGAYGLLVHAQTGRLSALVAQSRSDVESSGAAVVSGQLLVRAGVAALVLLPITVAFGASWSAAVAAARKIDARRAGRLYAALTLGNIVGLAVAAWGVLPNFRLDRGLVVVLVAAFLAPLPALTTMSLPLLARVVVVVLFGAAAGGAWYEVPDWPSRLLRTAVYWADSASGGTQRTKLGGRPVTTEVVRFQQSSFETSVTVVQAGANRMLLLDGKTTGSTIADDVATQSLLGALPAALHRDVKRALVIGLGTGQTPAEVLRFPVERVDCAEISPKVALTMPLFEAVNRRCDQDRRFRLLEADGRTVLRYGGAKYDLVVSEPSNIWIPGVAHLYTRESFEDVRDCLADHGLCCQWLQGYTLDPAMLKTVVRTFLSVFAHGSLWSSGVGPEADVFLVGSREPLDLDFAALERRLGAAGVPNPNDLDRPMSASSLLRCFVAGSATLRKWVGDGPLTSDARPSLEYAAEEALLSSGPESLDATLAQLCEPSLVLFPDGGASLPAEVRATLERRAADNVAVRRFFESNGGKGVDSDALLAFGREHADDREVVVFVATLVASAIENQVLAAAYLEGREPPREALDLMQRLVDFAPDHPGSLQFAALLATTRGKVDEALQKLDRCAALSPPWRVEPELFRAKLLVLVRRPRQAIDVLKKIVDRDPYVVSAWQDLEKAYRLARDPQKADDAQRHVVALQNQ
jgi:spermidine synthase